jgi:RNase P/RNase MRP subunit p30
MELLLLGKEASVEKVAKRILFARMLGHKAILLLFQTHAAGNKALTTSLKERFTELSSGILIATVNQAKSLAKHYDLIVAPSQREFFECKTVHFLLEPERQSRKDFIHHRNSGLHQVLLKACTPTTKRKEKGIITTARILRKSRHPEEILGRMMQNARWCKKYGVAYHVTSGATTLMEQRDTACLQALTRELTKG